MNLKKIISLIFMTTFLFNSSFPITLREAWEDFKKTAEEVAEEILDNVEITITSQDEIRYANNETDAIKSFEKLEKKYYQDFQCLNSRSPKGCLKRITVDKFQHRANNPHIAYFENLKTNNKKATHNFQCLGFFKKFTYDETQQKLKILQDHYKELFKKELRERYKH